MSGGESACEENGVLYVFRVVTFACELGKSTLKMCERQNTIMCAFDLRDPHILVYKIYK